jgi:hypothetical protein
MKACFSDCGKNCGKFWEYVEENGKDYLSLCPTSVKVKAQTTGSWLHS